MGIPVKEFVRLNALAEKALKRGDLAEIERINEKLAVTGFKLIVRDGQLFVQQPDRVVRE